MNLKKLIGSIACALRLKPKAACTKAKAAKKIAERKGVTMAEEKKETKKKETKKKEAEVVVEAPKVEAPKRKKP